MKTAIIVCMLVLLTSVASAEIYSWEDENGINFTDEASSVPEKYREKFFAKDAKDNTQPVNSIQVVKVRVPGQKKPDILHEKNSAVQQAKPDWKRSSAETAKQKQIRIREFQNTLEALIFYIEVMAMLGTILFVVWIITIADIVKSEFIKPSNKTAWLLLVLLLPLIGVLPYIILGSNYKWNPVSHKEKYRPELFARLSSRGSNVKRFVM